MKRVFAMLFIVALSACASRQPITQRYLATKTPYHSPLTKPSPPPVGCRPVHIEGIFRHGSRYLNDDKDIEKLIALLEQQKTTSTLAPDMMKALQWAYEARSTFQAGMLTKQGERELNDMGRRLVVNYPELFSNKDGLVQMVSAPKARVKDSLESLRAGLASASTVRIEVQPVQPEALRYFAHCKNYQAYKAKLKTAHVKGLAKSDEDIIASSLYSLCQQDCDIDFRQADDRFCSLLTPQMRKSQYEKSRAKSYHKFGPAANSGMACILLEPLFARIEDVVEGRSDVLAHLSFGHAETVVPLSVFFELFEVPLKDWDVSQVAPMAVNLQLVTYECSLGERKSHKVKLLYNEKEHAFRVPECQNSAYCDWQTVKAYYERRKQTLGVNSCSEADWNSFCGNKKGHPSLE